MQQAARWLVVLGLVAAGGAASAQPVVEEPASAPPASVDPPASDTPPLAPPADGPGTPAAGVNDAPVAAPAPTVAPPALTIAPLRPTAFSVALGLGYLLPMNLLEPSITTVRFRLPSGLALEPGLALARGRSSTGLDYDPAPLEEGRSAGLLTAIVRLPLRSRGRVDLEGVGIGIAGITSERPDGADNDTTTTTFQLGWGLGLTYWVSPHWTLSATASNPLVSYTREATQQGTAELVRTQTVVGVVFSAELVVMAHLVL